VRRDREHGFRPAQPPSGVGPRSRVCVSSSASWDSVPKKMTASCSCSYLTSPVPLVNGKRRIACECAPRHANGTAHSGRRRRIGLDVLALSAAIGVKPLSWSRRLGLGACFASAELVMQGIVWSPGPLSTSSANWPRGSGLRPAGNRHLDFASSFSKESQFDFDVETPLGLLLGACPSVSTRSDRLLVARSCLPLVQLFATWPSRPFALRSPASRSEPSSARRSPAGRARRGRGPHSLSDRFRRRELAVDRRARSEPLRQRGLRFGRAGIPRRRQRRSHRHDRRTYWGRRTSQALQ